MCVLISKGITLEMLYHQSAAMCYCWLKVTGFFGNNQTMENKFSKQSRVSCELTRICRCWCGLNSEGKFLSAFVDVSGGLQRWNGLVWNQAVSRMRFLTRRQNVVLVTIYTPKNSSCFFYCYPGKWKNSLNTADILGSMDYMKQSSV